MAAVTACGDISAYDLIASNELHVDGAAILNSTLTVGGVDVLSALAAKQDALSSTAALSVGTVRATGTLAVPSTVKGVEMGINGIQSLCRIVGEYAYLRLEGIGESQSFQGFTLQRTRSTGEVYATLGTVAHQMALRRYNFFSPRSAASKALQLTVTLAAAM